MCEVNVGEYYKHFKGGVYQVLELAKNSENLEDVVVYGKVIVGQGNKTYVDYNNIWVRPLSMWSDIVDRPEYRYRGERFIRIENSKENGKTT